MSLSTEHDTVCYAQPDTMNNAPERILALSVIATATYDRDSAFFFNPQCEPQLKFWCEAAGLNHIAVRNAQRGRFQRNEKIKKCRYEPRGAKMRGQFPLESQ